MNRDMKTTGRKDIDAGNVVVDEIAGGWWVWSKSGEALVVDKPLRDAAVRAYVGGERVRKRRALNLTISDETRAHLEETEKRTGVKPART